MKTGVQRQSGLGNSIANKQERRGLRNERDTRMDDCGVRVVRKGLRIKVGMFFKPAKKQA